MADSFYKCQHTEDDKIMETVVIDVIFLYENGVGRPYVCNTACLLLGIDS